MEDNKQNMEEKTQGADESFHSVVTSLFQGMDSMAAAKTVVGDAIHINDTIILPLVDVSFGIAAGTAVNDTKKTNSGGGGMGAKMQPCAVLVIHNGATRLVNVKNQGIITKILDMAPDILDRFIKKKPDPTDDPDVRAAVDAIFNDEEPQEE